MLGLYYLWWPANTVASMEQGVDVGLADGGWRIADGRVDGQRFRADGWPMADGLNGPYKKVKLKPKKSWPRPNTMGRGEYGRRCGERERLLSCWVDVGCNIKKVVMVVVEVVSLLPSLARPDAADLVSDENPLPSTHHPGCRASPSFQLANCAAFSFDK